MWKIVSKLKVLTWCFTNCIHISLPCRAVKIWATTVDRACSLSPNNRKTTWFSIGDIKPEGIFWNGIFRNRETLLWSDFFMKTKISTFLFCSRFLSYSFIDKFIIVSLSFFHHLAFLILPLELEICHVKYLKKSLRNVQYRRLFAHLIYFEFSFIRAVSAHISQEHSFWSLFIPQLISFFSSNFLSTLALDREFVIQF